MDINSVQGGGSPQFLQQHQAQLPTQKQTQSTGVATTDPVMTAAEVNASASLQAYQQQSRESYTRSDSVDIKSSNILKNLHTVKAIEQMQTRLNDLVKGVRESTEQLNSAAEQVSRMQGNLMTIVKNYPPYPIESSERRELLMSYMSLRKEIEDLMIPPPPQPVYEKIKSMWDAMFSQNGQILASAVPSLDAGSGDKQVQAASEKLAETSGTLAAISDGVTQGLLG